MKCKRKNLRLYIERKIKEGHTDFDIHFMDYSASIKFSLVKR